MTKNNFLLINLNDQKTKKLVETITSDTSRKILDHLALNDDTETNISTNLTIPLPTVHYHLQKLKEAGLVIVDEFHYSKKGREVQHYKLANKYIIIAPKTVSDISETLKSLLPAVLLSAGIALIIKILTTATKTVAETSGSIEQMVEKVVVETGPALEQAIADTALRQEVVAETTNQTVQSSIASQPNIAVWFVLGGITTIVLYLAVEYIRKYLKR